MRIREDLKAISDLATRQRGLLTRAQLLELGLDERRIQRLVTQRWLRALHQSVYAAGHEAITWEARCLAAVFAFDGSVLSDRSCGSLWDLVTPAGRIHVTLTRPTSHARRDQVIPHRRRLAPHEITTRNGIPCTTLARTILDLGATASPRLLAAAFEEAQVRHKLQPETVAEALVLRRGHRGAARVRAVLADGVDPDKVQSMLELRFLKFCRDAGLPRPQTQYWIAGWPVDFYFDDVKLAVETDGDRFHFSAAKRERDRRKTAAVEAAGTPVLRLGWGMVVDRPLAARALVADARSVASAQRVA